MSKINPGFQIGIAGWITARSGLVGCNTVRELKHVWLFMVEAW